MHVCACCCWRIHSCVDTDLCPCSYHMFLLTTIESNGAVTLHRKVSNTSVFPNLCMYCGPDSWRGEQNNLVFDGTLGILRIGEYNKNSFFAGNSQTSGTFPGFQLNEQYRVFINYFFDYLTSHPWRPRVCSDSDFMDTYWTIATNSPSL